MPAVDLIRHHWLPGLYRVSDKGLYGLGHWFVAKEYQAYDLLLPGIRPKRADQFTLTISDPSQLLSPIAFDCNRMSMACFESLQSIIKVENLPRSTAWLLLKSYYAAFFAAHSILRMLGISCVYLDGDQPAAINEIFALFGSHRNLIVGTGNYVCSFDANKRKLTCIKSDIEKGGSHQFLWSCFYNRIKALTDEILQGSGLTSEKQHLATQLIYLADNLCANGQSGGGWLSFVRNRINYKHDYGCWFPYEGRSKTFAAELFEISLLWRSESSAIKLRSKNRGEIHEFLVTCSFIISLAREMILDMSMRHPASKSFHRYGTMALLNFSDKH